MVEQRRKRRVAEIAAIPVRHAADGNRLEIRGQAGGGPERVGGDIGLGEDRPAVAGDIGGRQEQPRVGRAFSAARSVAVKACAISGASASL